MHHNKKKKRRNYVLILKKKITLFKAAIAQKESYTEICM